MGEAKNQITVVTVIYEHKGNSVPTWHGCDLDFTDDGLSWSLKFYFIFLAR